MQNISLAINSSRRFQQELEGVIKEKYPEVKPEIYIRKAFDAYQTTVLLIAGTNLLINIIRLIVLIQKNHPDSKTEIILEVDETEKTLKIDTTKHDIDIEKIVSDFLK